MTRVLHTARISYVDSVMFFDRIREVVSFELIFIILFTKHDAIYIADPSNMQDPCNINFVIDLDHRKDYVAKW